MYCICLHRRPGRTHTNLSRAHEKNRRYSKQLLTVSVLRRRIHFFFFPYIYFRPTSEDEDGRIPCTDVQLLIAVLLFASIVSWLALEVSIDSSIDMIVAS